ncbi:hypothetical protein [Roseovarius sp. 2305UL8-3]|uniref:hypothetical protein n=1 Tax=Roseovarius conchicola TaxID=3121636 RepID=UPI00352861E5
MMRLLWPAILGGILLASSAQAGPWLRSAGEGFLSFSIEAPVSEIGPSFATTYLEYGLNKNVTLGFDLGGTQDDLYKAIVFAKMAFGSPDSPFKIAAELGVGTTEQEAVLRPGLSIGRGFSLGDRSGWMAVDTLARIEIDGGNMDITTDITVGLNLGERTKVMVQLQSGHHLMNPEYLKLAPSFVYERKPGQHIELGALAGINNSEDLGLKIGLWQKF